MSSTKFICARCGAEKDRGWSQEEAYEEYLQVIPKEDQTVEDDVTVCTECYIIVLQEHGIPLPPYLQSNQN